MPFLWAKIHGRTVARLFLKMLHHASLKMATFAAYLLSIFQP